MILINSHLPYPLSIPYEQAVRFNQAPAQIVVSQTDAPIISNTVRGFELKFRTTIIAEMQTINQIYLYPLSHPQYSDFVKSQFKAALEKFRINT